MQIKRLSDLIEFTRQTALLRTKPISEISRHGIFEASESDIIGLPGVYINPMSDNEESDSIWLKVDRLSETQAPIPGSLGLQPWIEITKGVSKEPAIFSVINAGLIFSDEELKIRELDSQAPIHFESFDSKEDIEKQYQSYLLNVWKPWANEERQRRKTISLYSKLFSLKQQLDGDLGDGQLEFAWGVGIALWKTETFKVDYPMITQLAEISLDEKTLAIMIRPRETDPRVELEVFMTDDNPGIAALDKASKEFFSQQDFVFSPFDRGTFEPILRSAVGNLDPNGKYWAENNSETDRSTPKADENLKITDTWVIFARPRNASIFLDDLARFQKLLEAGGEIIGIISSAISSIITDPSLLNEETILPAFRGVSMVSGSSESSGSEVKDLFFPMPFNDEQVRIIQLLETSNGVVVQGPPGTGKTHTIANVICHYLATGKKVLVTSMKDPALAVLREKLPSEIRPLAVSLLSSEQEGIKLFEFAVAKIASEIQRIDRMGLRREIERLESDLDTYHSRLAKNSMQTARIASRKLSPIEIEGVKIFPDQAAQEVMANIDTDPWLTDEITIEERFTPRFSEEDIAKLRETRRFLGNDLNYLGAHLPEIHTFPDLSELIRTHKDLSESSKIQSKIDSGEIPQLIDSSKETFQNARELFEGISNLRILRQRLGEMQMEGRNQFLSELRSQGQESPRFTPMWKIFQEIQTELAEKVKFIDRPIAIIENAESDAILIKAIQNLSEGKSAFSLLEFGKSEQKKMLAGIRIIASEPKSTEDWNYVLSLLNHRKRLLELIIRWNAVASEMSIPVVNPALEGIKEVERLGTVCNLIRKIVGLENTIKASISLVFPGTYSPEFVYDETKIEVIGKILSYHLMKNRLAEAWAIKERFQGAIGGCSGRVSRLMKDFFEQMVGNPSIEEDAIKNEWTGLLEELRRVRGLRLHLDTVSEITELIRDSGAQKWADHLIIDPAQASIDSLLPGNWRATWRLRRLENYLESSGVTEELRTLAREKKQIETDLARIYKETVEKRSWLSVAENATPNVRAALMAYMAAISKIGKGTGKRAIRYRKDARQAASLAHAAVPCWIMPHYRVSESFPADFGLFDLVVIDEASQSDLTALPAILRAKKVLVVGDDRQVSPEGIGLKEEDIKSLNHRYLSSQVETYRPQMTPERSVYDLFKVAFAKSSVMLREHFRCVSPIIEYSKREFYNHEIVPLRLPKNSERLDPPLVDVFISNGFRRGDTNAFEARFIVDEIRSIISNPEMKGRSIGVVSLLADKQALKIREMIESDIGIDAIREHHIACGDARTFQGKERDIMFLSMVVSPGEASAISRESFAQRFNVAASRARDRMYLVRSVKSEDLSNADTHRKSLVAHFALPFNQDDVRVEDLRKLCESDFEREVYDLLVERGYRVVPQVKVGSFRIDMVIEGHNDARIAIECDGDRYHGADVWDDDMRRQGILERAGWTFWRCFASDFVMRREEVLCDLFNTLTRMGIDPIGHEDAGQSIYVEKREIEIPETQVYEDTIQEEPMIILTNSDLGTKELLVA